MYGSDTISIFHNCSRSRHVITSSDLLGRHGRTRGPKPSQLQDEGADAGQHAAKLDAASGGDRRLAALADPPGPAACRRPLVLGLSDRALLAPPAARLLVDSGRTPLGVGGTAIDCSTHLSLSMHSSSCVSTTQPFGRPHGATLTVEQLE